MSAGLDAALAAETLAAVAERLAAARDELCRLDGAIGDGDHGLAMASGFAAAAEAAKALDLNHATLAEVFNAAAKALLNAIGASSGPLYATALMHAAKAAGPVKSMPWARTPALVAAMAEGVRARGHAEPGDKTMLDAWGPAAEAAKSDGSLAETFARMREAATRGAEATAAMVAVKGRAARLGERARGHIDPGAVSAALIIETITQFWGEGRAMKTL